MDTHTLGLLEFGRIRELVAGYAACSLGKERARALAPTADVAAIRHRQAMTTEMTEALASGLAPPLGGIHDIRTGVRRAAVGAILTAEELAEVASVLRSLGEVDRWLGRIGHEFPRLGALKATVGEFSGVANTIDGCLDERARVLDTASRRLSVIRREIHQVEERIQETLRRLLRSPDIRRILRYPNFTMVGHHYVLPVSKDHRGEIEGSVHRTSASNETVFIEPRAIAEQSAQLSYHRSREEKEIRRILRWLSAQVGQVADALLGTLETVAELDLVHAQGRYSLDYRMSPPDLNDEGRIALRGARHPLLLALFRDEAKARKTTPAPTPITEANGEGEDQTPKPPPPPPAREPRSVVPIDVRLGFEANMLVVTGPNTGGKTVALKTTALLAVMAQCGLHIPAGEGSQLPVFDQILADIGDEQSLEQSLSTFSSHMRRIGQVLTTATERSLVVLDEMGAGTDPAEGAALGRAILDELDSIGCRAIVTTHIGDLKTYAFTNPRAENAAVEFDEATLQPLYRLRIGDIGLSNALLIARRLAVPEHLVARAETYLEQAKGRELPEWEIIQKLRREAEEARTAAMAAQAEAERQREALSQRLTDLQTQAELDTRMADARARLQPGDRVVVPKLGYDRPGRVVKVDARKGVASVAIGAMKWDVPIAELVPQLIRPPEVPGASAPAGKAKPAPTPRPGMRLEDFGDE
jgi:DNA mismatch repair protein MutS2